MSKINSCYPLCPLIDQNSFFGVSDDSESGYVLVTLGKNMVVRYKLADQKQVNSWNTKVRLSSPVVFDRNSRQYVGVFNSNTVQMWSEYDIDLKKVKKYKFTEDIHCIIPNSYTEANDPSPVIAFKNGSVAPLTLETLANKKHLTPTPIHTTPNLLAVDTSYSIEDAHLLICSGNVVVALVFSDNTNKKFICRILPLESNLFQPVDCNLSHRSRNDFSSAINENEVSDTELTGYTFISGNPLRLITSWSDGGLYCLDFCPSDSSLKDLNGRYPGQKIMNIDIINMRLKVAILPLDNIGCHIAVYGSDPCEEGALLAIVNIKHKVVQCKYHIKLYCTSPRLWSGGPNNLMLVIGQHLAVAHYRLVSQKLVALVGSRVDNILSSDPFHAEEQNQWQTQHKQTLVMESEEKAMSSVSDKLYPHGTVVMSLDEKYLAHGLKENVQKLLDEGLSEAGICDRLVPLLIEKHNAPALMWLFNKFSDVPFHCTLVVINYCLKLIRSDFSEEKENEEDDDDDKRRVSENNKTIVDNNDVTNQLLLCVLLSGTLVPDNKALALVRSELSLASVLLLMDYLADFMTQHPDNMILIEWATLLIDSCYQSFIITKNASMVKTFKRLSGSVKNQISFLSTWQDLVPLIKMIKCGKGAVKFSKSTDTNCLYSSDELNVY